MVTDFALQLVKILVRRQSQLRFIPNCIVYLDYGANLNFLFPLASLICSAAASTTTTTTLIENNQQKLGSHLWFVKVLKLFMSIFFTFFSKMYKCLYIYIMIKWKHKFVCSSKFCDVRKCQNQNYLLGYWSAVLSLRFKLR